MHVYLRCYAVGQPDGSPQRMADEYAARDAVLERFPQATFSERVEAFHQPNVNVGGIGDMLYAWPGSRRADPAPDRGYSVSGTVTW